MAAQTNVTNWNTVKALTTGTDVRITAGSRTVRGKIDRITDDTLVVTSGKGQEMFTQQEITLVTLRGESHRRRNALIGLGVGAAAGAIVGAVSYSKCTGFCIIDPSRGALMAGGAIVFGGVGALTGALIPGRGWRDIYKK